MRKSKAYSAINVKNVDVEKVLAGREGQAACLGIDMAKKRPVVMLRWGEGDFERPWSVKSPAQIPEVVALIRRLGEGRRLVVAMEPTGTYGDPLRQALADGGVELRRVSPKATHDYAETFDGVPSQHDGKDAAIVAELAAFGKSVVWAWDRPEAWEREMSLHVDWVDANRKILAIWCGRLEGLLARHWPEVLEEGGLSKSWLLRALMEHGGPERLGRDAEAADKLSRWSRGKLLGEKVQRIVAGARETRGVRQERIDRARMRAYARRARQAQGAKGRSERALRRLSAEHQTIQAMGVVVGVPTACALWVCLGDPRGYGHAAGYRKAMGLNLVERSSGEQQGRVHISKRGDSLVRRLMYLAALRWVRRDGSVRAWYEAKRCLEMGGSRDGRLRRKATLVAVVGVMRRLALAVHLAGMGRTFDAARLFPGGGVGIGRVVKRKQGQPRMGQEVCGSPKR